MKEITLNTKITINVKTEWGPRAVTFKVIDKSTDSKFALMAQNKVVIGQRLQGGYWKLSNPVDLLTLSFTDGIHEQLEQFIDPESL